MLDFARSGQGSSCAAGVHRHFPLGTSLEAAGRLFAVKSPMTKTLEAIGEAVRDSKHVFHKLENQPKKPQRHRYERRKIRGYLQLTHWQEFE